MSSHRTRRINPSFTTWRIEEIRMRTRHHEDCFITLDLTVDLSGPNGCLLACPSQFRKILQSAYRSTTTTTDNGSTEQNDTGVERQPEREDAWLECL